VPMLARHGQPLPEVVQLNSSDGVSRGWEGLYVEALVADPYRLTRLAVRPDTDLQAALRKEQSG
jgi:hypothetical protein